MQTKLERLDAWLATLAPEIDDEFVIPTDIVAVESIRDAAGLAKLFACQWGIETGDRLAPRKSWLWSLWREAMFLSANMPSRLDDPAECLTASKAGPIECWLVAEMFDFIGRDADARACAKIGLDRATTSAFGRECGELLCEGYWSGDLPRQVVRMLRELTEDEAMALVSGMVLCGLGDEAMLKPAKVLAQLSSEHREEPMADVVPKALDLLWRDCLRQAIEDSLHGLARKPMSKAELQALIDHIEVEPLK